MVPSRSDRRQDGVGEAAATDRNGRRLVAEDDAEAEEPGGLHLDPRALHLGTSDRYRFRLPRRVDVEERLGVNVPR